jgi:serine/threonine protein kinase
MSESSPDLPTGDERKPANGDADVSASPPILPISAADPTDNTATVISKSMPRPMSNEEAANAIRGRKLAHFELLDRIGVGGMAAVLRARDTQLDRLVALKILPPDLAADPENVRRFHQEARSAAKLDHENVARVFFCGEDQRLHFIAFEFVDGENLRTILEQRGRLPVAEAVHYMLQIAAGLAHAAHRGVVHRDIKPSNIIITPTGRAKLVDMGLARSLEPQHDHALTQSGVTLGTFDYISPEQALEPRDADVRSDIYSLGCTFYHMITGSPPVPDGTAARKLHHHQHIKPRDPRELVPGLPDDVAVILDRMLAKEPRDRYQTPQQLVQHLLLAARKLGAPSEVPEGVLSMEAVVPNPPRYRPFLLAALATVAVVVLIVFIGQTVSTQLPSIEVRFTPPAKVERDRGPSQVVKDGGAPQVSPTPGPPPPDPKKLALYESDDVTPYDLARWLKDNAGADEIEVRLARDLDLLPARDEGADVRLVFKAKKVTIRSKDISRPVTVRLTYGATSSPSTRTAFVIDSKDATVEGLSFLIDARSYVRDEDEMIGLLCAAGGSYRVHGCQFIQANAPQQQDQRKGLASVVVEGSGGLNGRTRLLLSECCFLGFGELSKAQGEPDQPEMLLLHKANRGGYDAVVRRGSAQIEAVDCAFGPHSSIFLLEGKTATNEVLVRHCSVLAGRHTSVFALGDDAAAALKVEYSLFSRTGEGEGERDGAVLVRQSNNPGVVSYKERENRYHRLDAYWAGLAWDRPKIPQGLSRELAVNPWKDEQPLERLEGLRFADPAAKAGAADRSLYAQRLDQIGAAFQVNFQEHAADVQPANQPRDLIGVEHLATFSFVAKLKDREAPIAHKERVVDPSVTESRDGVYPNLRLAVTESRPGDVILIKHNGDLPIRPVQLDDPAADLTIRPYPDWHPVLVLGTTNDADVALFRVVEGKIQFEGLEFRLEPKDPKFKSQVVATVIGNGQCGFKNCVVTLDPAAAQGTALAMLSFADPGGMMKADTTLRPQQPLCKLENCVVRGQGDFIWDRVGRPFELDVRNTLAVLAGQFLNRDVTAETPTPALVSATLTNVTAYQTGHFIRVTCGKDVKNLPPLHCTASGCLFVAAAGHSLIHLEGLGTSEDRLKDKLQWTPGENGNAYAGFDDGMLDQRPPGEEMAPPAIASNKWKMFTGESTIKVERSVKFASAPSKDGPFTRVAPSQFKTTELTGYGAEVGTLPKPALSNPEMQD